MLFNYLQRALQHLNSHPPKLSSADLALLIYTPLNLGEVTEPSLSGALGRKAAVHTSSGGLWLTFPFPLAVPCSPRSVNQSAGCQRETGWRLAGDALLSCSFDPPSLTSHGVSGGGKGGGGGARGCAVFHLFPPLI